MRRGSRKEKLTFIHKRKLLNHGKSEPVPAGAGREDCLMQFEGREERERTSQVLKAESVSYPFALVCCTSRLCVEIAAKFLRSASLRMAELF